VPCVFPQYTYGRVSCAGRTFPAVNPRQAPRAETLQIKAMRTFKPLSRRALLPQFRSGWGMVPTLNRSCFRGWWSRLLFFHPFEMSCGLRRPARWMGLSHPGSGVSLLVARIDECRPFLDSSWWSSQVRSIPSLLSDRLQHLFGVRAAKYNALACYRQPSLTTANRPACLPDRTTS